MPNEAAAHDSARPSWFRLTPAGPHERSGGLGCDGYTYEFYCTKDGQTWPCAAERARTSR
ncbi:MAG: hypothetical protein ACRD0P_03775 [Stackebrandtia sp.]